MARMGRPTKLTLALAAPLCEALRKGATYELASKHAGIDPDTLRAWLKQGADAKSATPARLLYEAVAQAEAAAALNWLELIDRAMEIDWRAAAWKLERRYPHAYGRILQEVQHSGEVHLIAKAETVQDRIQQRLTAIEAASNGHQPA